MFSTVAFTTTGSPASTRVSTSSIVTANSAGARGSSSKFSVTVLLASTVTGLVTEMNPTAITVTSYSPGLRASN